MKNKTNIYVVYLTTYNGSALPTYYIGSTVEKRIYDGNYFGSIKSKKWKTIFNYEIKNNKHLFSVKILSQHGTRKEALEEELKLQIQYNVVKSKDFFNEALASPNGFFGMSQKGKIISQETKEKLSKAHKGKVLTLEHRKKLSEAHKGKKISSETKLKMSESGKGRKFSEEHKNKISSANKKISDETKEKIKQTRKLNGKEWHSIETREKIGLANKNRKVSDETKLKMSESQKKRRNKN